MFDGELAGLQAISKTKTIRVPTPVKVIDTDANCMIIMEYLNLTSGHNRQAGELHTSNPFFNFHFYLPLTPIYQLTKYLLN